MLNLYNVHALGGAAHRMKIVTMHMHEDMGVQNPIK
jgi:hypothetical protein